MTALMGASGAGKTTLLDVLAGRKTTGEISGSIFVNGSRADSTTFQSMSSFAEQEDIHADQCTVLEALEFSATSSTAWSQYPQLNVETSSVKFSHFSS